VLGLEHAFDGTYRSRSGPPPLSTDKGASNTDTAQPVITVIVPPSEFLKTSWASTPDGRRQLMTAGDVSFMLGPSTRKAFYSSHDNGSFASHYAFFGPDTSADAAGAYVTKAWLRTECDEATQLHDERVTRLKNISLRAQGGAN
jgi:hypothetical protein